MTMQVTKQLESQSSKDLEAVTKKKSTFFRMVGSPLKKIFTKKAAAEPQPKPQLQTQVTSKSLSNTPLDANILYDTTPLEAQPKHESLGDGLNSS